MKQSDNDKALLESINRKLDDGLDAMDDETKDALRNIRLSAQAQAKHDRHKIRQWLSPMPIMVAASLLMVLSVSLRMTMTPSFDATPALEDMPLLTATEGIEFYDDLEFYQWLEATQYNG